MNGNVQPIWMNQSPYCGNCGRHLKSVGRNVKDRYCGDCGVRIKWTECNPFNGEPVERVESKSAMIVNRELEEKIKRLGSELKNARNELCLRCGLYKKEHLGACDGCRYQHGGEWSKDLD